jgi:hypothetical protein
VRKIPLIVSLEYYDIDTITVNTTLYWLCGGTRPGCGGQRLNGAMTTKARDRGESANYLKTAWLQTSDYPDSGMFLGCGYLGQPLVHLLLVILVSR